MTCLRPHRGCVTSSQHPPETAQCWCFPGPDPSLLQEQILSALTERRIMADAKVHVQECTSNREISKTHTHCKRPPETLTAHDIHFQKNKIKIFYFQTLTLRTKHLAKMTEVVETKKKKL